MSFSRSGLELDRSAHRRFRILCWMLAIIIAEAAALLGSLIFAPLVR